MYSYVLSKYIDINVYNYNKLEVHSLKGAYP